MSPTSPSLLQRVRRPDDQAASARLVELYTPLIFFWTTRAGVRGEEARDLVQDVFVTLVKKLPEFEYDARKGCFRGWLRTITLNRWRDWCKAQRVRVHVGAEPLADVPAPAEAMWEETEYRQYLARRMADIMKAEFEERIWTAFQGVAVHGRPAAEVAAELHMTPAAVHQARYRVLCRLREELAGLLD